MKLSLHRHYAAAPGSVSQARHDISVLATRAGASPEEIDRIALAASEAVTNVVAHAYSDGGGEVEVLAALAGDNFSVIVSDRGAGFRLDHRSNGLGLGLVLMCTACDAVTLARRAGGGIEVRMQVAIAAPRARGSALYARGSVASASIAASPRFSTTT